MRTTTMMRAFENVDVRLTPRSPNQDPKVRAKLITKVTHALERRYTSKGRRR